MEAQNYADARILYNALGSYKDSATKRKRCDYAIASAALTAGDYATAVSGFEALGSYKDSATMYEEAVYQQALALKAAGDHRGCGGGAGGEFPIAIGRRTSWPPSAIDARRRAGGGGRLRGGGARSTPPSKTARRRKERYNACMYALAEGLRDAGELTAAGAAFEALGALSGCRRAERGVL